MRDLVGYTRVTIDGPVESVLSADAQTVAIERWARAHRDRVVAIVRDEGAAASHIEGRLGLADALAMVRDGRARGLVVARLDRLADDALGQELLIAEVRRRHATVHSARPGEQRLIDDGADPERALIRQVLDAIADHEGAMRALRVRHRLGKGDLPSDREGAALGRIEQMSDEGVALGQIAKRLTAEGFSPKHSHLWDREGLRRIVARIRHDREALRAHEPDAARYTETGQ
jgi:DNA invertase Pin-like site-specific DNA recombinase